MEIGPRLRTLREAAGITLDGLSRATGMAASNLSQIETGKTDPRWSTIERILDALGTDVGSLTPGGMEDAAQPIEVYLRGSSRDPWARLRRRAERGEDVSEEARALAINTRRRASA